MFDKKAYNKQWNQKHKEICNERYKQWAFTHPDKIKEYRKKHYQNHKKQILEENKQWCQDHKEHRKDYCKQYHLDHKKERNEYGEQWRLINREKICKRQKQYLQTKAGKANNQRGHSKRKAREKNIINTLTAEEWIDILKKYKFRCAYCGKEFTLFDRETRDHVIPISKGGDNIKENIVPACKSCNSKKKNKILLKGGVRKGDTRNNL